MKVRKVFTYDGIELKIVEREEELYEGKTYTATRVMAPNGGTIPLQLKSNQTLENIVEETVKALDNFKKMGADVKSELLN